MRAINKTREPACLAHCRSIPNTTFDSLDAECKDDLRTALVREQRGLCCYCMSRIRPARDVMKIAHWHAQTRHPGEQLDYANLLGACLGNEGQPKSRQHCDTRQADDDISLNPADLAHQVERHIRYQPNGTIVSSDREFDKELNAVLNLNLSFLKNNRKATLDGFIKSLPRQGDLSRTGLERWLSDWSGQSDPGDLQPYCQVVVYWLRKKLAQK